MDTSSINIDHCTIANNGEVGLHLPYYGLVFVKSSEITGNAIGIQSLADDSEVEIHASNIINNRVTIDVIAKQNIKGENNYWGTVDQQHILASFVDGQTKPGSATVRFEPFEKKAVAEAGCTFKLSQ